jgi:cation transport ATPase
VIRAEAREAIYLLNALGVKTVMLTGDNIGAAEGIARVLDDVVINTKLGDRYVSLLLPLPLLLLLLLLLVLS